MLITDHIPAISFMVLCNVFLLIVWAFVFHNCIALVHSHCPYGAVFGYSDAAAFIRNDLKPQRTLPPAANSRQIQLPSSGCMSIVQSPSSNWSW